MYKPRREPESQTDRNSEVKNSATDILDEDPSWETRFETEHSIFERHIIKMLETFVDMLVRP